MRLADATDPIAHAYRSAYHHPSSAYVWVFYLPVVGLTAMGCYCYLASLVEQGCSEAREDEIAKALGLDNAADLVEPLATLHVAGMVELGGGVCGVKLRLPTMNADLECRLPGNLKHLHARARAVLGEADGQPAVAASPVLETMQMRARSLAISLLRGGHDRTEVEAALAEAGYHPSLVASSAAWALWHLVVSLGDGFALYPEPATPPTPLDFLAARHLAERTPARAERVPAPVE